MTMLRRGAITLAVTCLLGAFAILTEAQEKKGKKSNGAAAKMTTAERDEVLKFINDERKKHNLPDLKLSTTMDDQAQTWADHLHKIGKLVHGGFKGDRGQCIAEGQPTPEAVTKAWMSDKGHRDILLGKSYKELGAGRAGKFWVTDFK